jgi:hypothetical protein
MAAGDEPGTPPPAVVAVLDRIALDCTGDAGACDALAELRDACRSGDPESCASLGHHYQVGAEGLPRVDERSAVLLEYACERGAPSGCVRFASLLDIGIGVPLDTDRALAIYHRYCDSDDPFPWACFGLARSYAGLGRVVDPERTQHYLERGCQLGEAVACEFFACMDGGAAFFDCFRSSSEEDRDDGHDGHDGHQPGDVTDSSRP